MEPKTTCPNSTKTDLWESSGWDCICFMEKWPRPAPRSHKMATPPQRLRLRSFSAGGRSENKIDQLCFERKLAAQGTCLEWCLVSWRKITEACCSWACFQIVSRRAEVSEVTLIDKTRQVSSQCLILLAAAAWARAWLRFVCWLGRAHFPKRSCKSLGDVLQARRRNSDNGRHLPHFSHV